MFYFLKDLDYGWDIIKCLGCGDDVMLFGCLREKNIEDFFIVFELIYSLLDFGYEYFVVMVDGEFLIDELVKLFE